MRLFRKIRYYLKVLSATICYYLGRTHQCGCGHLANRKTVLTIDGHSGVYVLPKTLDYCPDCFKKAAIKCAWCGETILPGDPITLYTPRVKDFQIPEHAVVYGKDPLQLVGCLSWECAESGVDRAGFWVMPGKVQRALSPIEMVIMNGGIEPVLISDISDPNQAILVNE